MHFGRVYVCTAMANTSGNHTKTKRNHSYLSSRIVIRHPDNDERCDVTGSCRIASELDPGGYSARFRPASSVSHRPNCERSPVWWMNVVRFFSSPSTPATVCPIWCLNAHDKPTGANAIATLSVRDWWIARKSRVFFLQIADQ